MSEDQREVMTEMYMREENVYLRLSEAEHAARIIMLAQEYTGKRASRQTCHAIEQSMTYALRATIRRFSDYGPDRLPELVKIQKALATMPQTTFTASLFGLKIADLPAVCRALESLTIPPYTPAAASGSAAPAPQYKNPFRIS